jgi:hypothetical protein
MSESKAKAKVRAALAVPRHTASLSRRTIEKILRSSARGAGELDAKLKMVFALSEANASLRLK